MRVAEERRQRAGSEMHHTDPSTLGASVCERIASAWSAAAGCGKAAYSLKPDRKPKTVNCKPYVVNPKAKTLNPNPYVQNPKSKTLSPKP
eukprot:839930-Rhodomonas_salina.2